MHTQRTGAQRRFAATRYVALALGGLLAVYVLNRAYEPEPSGDLLSCIDPWGADAKVASNCATARCPYLHSAISYTELPGKLRNSYRLFCIRGLASSAS